MTAFRDLETARPPERTLVVPPSAFADDWEGRPDQAVCCGLRRISAGDVFTARAEAAKASWVAHPTPGDDEGREEAYNDALMRWVIARATCNANNARESWDLWGDLPDDTVFDALTPEGTRFIFDAVERLCIESSPVQIEASNEDVALIVEALAIGDATGPAVGRARRLLGFVADELGVAGA